MEGLFITLAFAHDTRTPRQPSLYNNIIASELKAAGGGWGRGGSFLVLV